MDLKLKRIRAIRAKNTKVVLKTAGSLMKTEKWKHRFWIGWLSILMPRR